MLDDYGKHFADGVVSILGEADGAIVGLIVLLPKTDHMLLDNIAVRPDRHRRGLGRMLIAFADAEVRRMGFAELRLYTHEKMTENIALYTRLGFEATGRGQRPATTGCSCANWSLIFHNIYYATNGATPLVDSARPVALTPAAAIEIVHPRSYLLLPQTAIPPTP